MIVAWAPGRLVPGLGRLFFPGAQMAGGDRTLFGVMMESFQLDGDPSINSDAALPDGLSVTDACMGWERTVPALEQLADAIRPRRHAP